MQDNFLFFKNELFELSKIHRIIKKHIPTNRKQGYYPDYFYTNIALFCRTELHSIDAQNYVAEYTKKYDT